MNLLKGILTSFGPRLIAAAVGGAATWLVAHTKGAVTIDPNTATEMIVGGLTAYAASHKAISSIVNPGDGAKLRVNEAIKAATDSPVLDTVKIPGKDQY